MFLFFISNSILELTTIVGPYGHTTGIDFGWQHPFIKGGGNAFFFGPPPFVWLTTSHRQPRSPTGIRGCPSGSLFCPGHYYNDYNDLKGF